jgi:hypothetical protein
MRSPLSIAMNRLDEAKQRTGSADASNPSSNNKTINNIVRFFYHFKHSFDAIMTKHRTTLTK